MRLKEAIKPEFAFTDKDQKSLGVKSASNDAGAMIGIRILFESDSPTLGAPVVALGDYVRDTILRVDMEAMIFEKCLQNQTMDQSMRIEKIRDDFKITLEEKRAQTLRALRSTDKSDTRQVVSLDNGGARYLSPQAQLNAVEINISELKLTQANRDNEVKLSELRKAYYCGAKSVLEKPINTPEIIVEMQKTQDSVFKDLDKKDPIVLQAATEFELQRETWSVSYLKGMRFVSPPETSEIKTRKLGRATGLILGTLLGGFLGILFVFIRNWWKSHQSEITAA